MSTESTPASVPGTPAPTPAPAHESIFHHLAALLPHLHHLGGWIIKAAPIAIQAGLHASPQAQLAITAIAAIHDVVEARKAAEQPAAESSEPSAEPAQ